ncbi:phosphatidylglycerophosphatase A, partial [bacterium]|nr:phosphatidylglycerophosphatase A [bacterium]
MLNRLTLVFATGLGAGFSPIASGTVGTVVAVPIFVLLSQWGTSGVLAGLAIITVLGIPAADHMERSLGASDPGRIVIDEIAGYLLAMAGSPVEARYIIAGFFLFRFFDIVKPPPVRQAEKYLPGGFGVVADDLLAGVYAW